MFFCVALPKVGNLENYNNGLITPQHAYSALALQDFGNYIKNFLLNIELLENIVEVSR